MSVPLRCSNLIALSYHGRPPAQQAADKGNKDARYSLYLPLLLGNRSSVAMDLPAAFKGMSDLAAEGHADAQWVCCLAAVMRTVVWLAMACKPPGFRPRPRPQLMHTATVA